MIKSVYIIIYQHMDSLRIFQNTNLIAYPYNINPIPINKSLYILIVQVLHMGNICCDSDGESRPRSLMVKRKKTLKDPQIKRIYEQQISSVINEALEKYSKKYTITSLKLKSLLGKGGQASVFMVDICCSKENELHGIYAMKRISKKKLDTQRTKEAIMLEKQILISYSCPFITQVQFAFQDKTYLYLVMKLAQGGDVYSLINAHDYKSEVFNSLGQYGIKFIIAGCILGLRYLHKNNIIYRDLKPQNILLFEDGYPKLADFGVAEKKQQELCFQIKGTMLYLAPEMLQRVGYGQCIDLWALGVLAYQLLFKMPPFTINQIKSLNFSQKIEKRFKKPYWPNVNVSQQAKNFIQSLLKVNPTDRLGAENFQDLMKHPFMAQIDWEQYEKKTIQSPLKHLVDNNKKEFVDRSLTNQIISQRESQYSVMPFTFVKNDASFMDSIEDKQSTSSCSDQ